jgi:hypothetical protein
MIMAKRGKYAGYEALDPFFAIIQEGLTGLADGEHFFDTFAEDAIFESRYDFPGWPMTIRSRAALADSSPATETTSSFTPGRLESENARDLA